jgi:hypothetical protein
MNKERISEVAALLAKNLEVLPRVSAQAAIEMCLRQIANEQITKDAEFVRYRADLCFQEAERSERVWGANDSQTKDHKTEAIILNIVAASLEQARSDSLLNEQIGKMFKA